MDIPDIHTLVEFMLANKIRPLPIRFFAYDTSSIHLYSTTGGRAMVVFYEGNNVKSILVQARKHRRYTYFINGQPGVNTKQIFSMDRVIAQ